MILMNFVEQFLINTINLLKIPFWIASPAARKDAILSFDVSPLKTAESRLVAVIPRRVRGFTLLILLLKY